VFCHTLRLPGEMTQDDLVFLQQMFVVPEVEELRELLRAWFNLTLEQDATRPHACPSRITRSFLETVEPRLRGFVGNLLWKQYGLWVIYHGQRAFLTRAEKRRVRKNCMIHLAHAKKYWIRLNNMFLRAWKPPMSVRLQLLSIGRRLLPIQTAPRPGRAAPEPGDLIPFPTASEEGGKSP